MAAEIAHHFSLMAAAGVALFTALRALGVADDAARRALTVGVLMGAASAGLMLLPVAGPFGATLDGRAGPAMFSGFMGGPLAAALTAVIGSTARLAVDGPLATSAVVVFCLYCALGVGLRRLWRWRDGDPLTLMQIGALAGASIAAAACAALAIRPWDLARDWLAGVFPVVALLNVASVVFVGGTLRVWIGLIDANRRLDALSTELQQALAGERRANAAKTRLVAQLSHEFRTPLSAIIGFGSLLRDVPDLAPDKADRYIAEIDGSARHLLSLVTDLLEFGETNDGETGLALERVDCAAAAARAIGVLHPVALQRGVRLETRGDAGAVARCNARALHQCLLNLLSNAVRHAPADSVVTLEVDARADGVHFTVIDAGPGMPAEMVQRIGEPFLRDPAQTGGRGDRVGLGLLITHTLMARQNGAISVDSAPGAGTRATLTLHAA